MSESQKSFRHSNYYTVNISPPKIETMRNNKNISEKNFPDVFRAGPSNFNCIVNHTWWDTTYFRPYVNSKLYFIFLKTTRVVK